MKPSKLILTGLANNKTSLGEVFRRYVECFNHFSNPDVYDISHFIGNLQFRTEDLHYPQYKGIVDHDLKYFHMTTGLYRNMKAVAIPKPKSNSKKIGYFVWESTEMFDEDSAVLDDFDEIWTASNYCKTIFSQYVDDSKIKVINHPIQVPLHSYTKFENFTILIMGNISSNVDRKNITQNIKVANIIKRKYKNVDIIFKTFTVCEQETILLNNLIANSEINVINEYYSSDKIKELIAKSHTILSLHRSEGFGLTLAEAMAVKTIPIATGYSGNMQFMNNSSCCVDYKLVDVSIPYFKGQWAEPDTDDAVSKLENLIENYENFIKISEKHLVNISDRFCYKAVANSMKSTLEI